MLGVGKLHRRALQRRLAEHRLAQPDVLVLDRRDQRLIHAVAGAQLEFLAGLIKHKDCAGLSAR